HMEVSYLSGFLNNNRTGVNMEQSHGMKWTWSNTANYRKTIDRHVFDILGGMEMNRERNISFNAYTAGEGAFVIETRDYMWPGVSTGTAEVDGGSPGVSFLSYISMMNYQLTDRSL